MADFHGGAQDRVAGPAPDHKSYGSFVSFEDPDGNGWLVQEITTRLPAGEKRPERSRTMTNTLTYQQMGTTARSQAHILFFLAIFSGGQER